MDWVTTYFDFFYALAFYLFFFVVVLSFRLLSGHTPNGSFCRYHLVSCVPYIGFRFLVFYFYIDSLSFWDVALGILLYFLIHYAISMNFIGLASRSVSSTLLIQLSQIGGKSSWSKLFDSYGEGKGFEFIKANRLENMVKYGLVDSSNNFFKVAPRGYIFFLANKFVLRLWKLCQIGASPKEPLR